MRRLFVLLFRLAITLAMVAVAGVVGVALWDYYLDAPWTRDGRVRADVVAIAPDVSGLVTEVLVSDNQNVRRGDVLFRIDPERFTLALRQAEAVVAGKSAAAVQSEKDYERYKQLSDAAVSQQRFELAQATAQEAKAAYDQAVADRDLAKLNLERSAVRPEIRFTPSGSGSSTMRTGIRWARRTQAKVGLTFASRFVPALRSRSSMPPAMLWTRPDNADASPSRRTVALSFT